MKMRKNEKKSIMEFITKLFQNIKMITTLCPEMILPSHQNCKESYSILTLHLKEGKYYAIKNFICKL